MKKHLIFLCVAIFCPSLYAQLQDSHFHKINSSEIPSHFKLDGSWKTQIEGSVLTNKESRERLMNVRLYGKFDLDFGSRLTALFEPYLLIQQGEIQSRFSRKESTIIQMRQGYFQWNPMDSLTLQLGSINQDYLASPLLVSNHSSLSLLGGYLHIRDRYEVQVIFQSSVPSIDNTFRRYNEMADTPYFNSLFTYFEWLPFDDNQASFRGHLTGFHFSTLPAFIAHRSKLYGNTILGKKSSASFAYRYYGLDFDLSSQFRLTPDIYLSLGYTGLINLGAPFAQSWGERIYTILDMNFWKGTKIYSRLEYFHNNSDASPAYFNSEIYGHNDRKGFLVELKAFFPKGNFEAGFRYVLSDPIRTTMLSFSLGDRQNAFMLFVSSRYHSI